MKKGFILLESVIAIFLITLLLLPIHKFSNLFVNLKNPEIKRAELPFEKPVKEKLTLGYDALATTINDGEPGTFVNLGISGESEENLQFLYFKLPTNIFNRDYIFISTPISQYGECP